jgi:hypothetical protein
LKARPPTTHGGKRPGAGRPKGPPVPNSGPATTQHVTAQHEAAETSRRRASRHRPPGEDAKRRERAQHALDLRIVGATYRQIATQLGVNERTAYYDVQDELGALDAVVKQKAERLRDLEAARLDRLNVALAPGIKAGAPSAIVAAVKVMERRAKLFGLDVPTKIAGPEGDAVTVRIVHQQVKD